MKRVLTAASALFSLAFGSAAHAGEFSAYLNGVERHDDLFVRVGLGLGSGGGETSGGVDLTGLGVTGHVAVGYQLDDNFGLMGEAFFVSIASPDADNVFGSPVVGAANSATLVGVGPGITCYFGRSNVYYAQSLGIVFGDYRTSTLMAPIGALTSKSTGGPGLGARSAIGWDFWVGDESSLGIALAMSLGSLPLDGDDSVLLLSAGVSLSYLWD